VVLARKKQSQFQFPNPNDGKKNQMAKVVIPKILGFFEFFPNFY